MAIDVYAHQEQQETTARRTLEMNVLTAPVIIMQIALTPKDHIYVLVKMDIQEMDILVRENSFGSAISNCLQKRAQILTMSLYRLSPATERHGSPGRTKS